MCLEMCDIENQNVIPEIVQAVKWAFFLFFKRNASNLILELLDLLFVGNCYYV